MRKILVTAALPYANGPLHLGHMLEHIQTDIWVRWQKIQGNSCIFICGDDAHGTPIMLSARQQGITPEELIAKSKLEHQADFAGFYIDFDNYYTTHSPENRELANTIYSRLKQNGDIEIKTVEQAYDPVANMFLPDRFVKGICPRCKAKDQYGDNCEVCGATYTTADLIDPVSVVSNVKPVQKSSEHIFFMLNKYTAMLQKWTHDDKHLQPEIKNKLKEWFNIGLKPWDISRDAPYFGFEIPDAPGKYFYVWLDAPIGYIASFQQLCKRNGLNFDTYWDEGSDTELYHFVGKDIIYFHALFWPAMLFGAKFRTPSSVFVHGYLTVNGQKMSKSRGTFILVSDYLKQFNPECLRYYFAAKLNAGIDDIDLNFADFAQRVNSDLVGKVVNIASRTANFINKYFAGKLASELTNQTLFDNFIAEGNKLAISYENRDFSNAMRQIMALADHANQYIDEQKPWALAKQNPHDPLIQQVCTMGLNLFRILMLYLKPVLPKMALEVEKFLQIEPLMWSDLNKPLLDHNIAEFKPLLQRIDATKMTF